VFSLSSQRKVEGGILYTVVSEEIETQVNLPKVTQQELEIDLNSRPSKKNHSLLLVLPQIFMTLA
jgi:hypothetical protein